MGGRRGLRRACSLWGRGDRGAGSRVGIGYLEGDRKGGDPGRDVGDVWGAKQGLGGGAGGPGDLGGRRRPRDAEDAAVQGEVWGVVEAGGCRDTCVRCRSDGRGGCALRGGTGLSSTRTFGLQAPAAPPERPSGRADSEGGFCGASAAVRLRPWARTSSTLGMIPARPAWGCVLLGAQLYRSVRNRPVVRGQQVKCD